jgi:hypothetical protein
MLNLYIRDKPCYLIVPTSEGPRLSAAGSSVFNDKKGLSVTQCPYIRNPAFPCFIVSAENNG